jgi:lipopolysaccharide exporter
VSTEVAGRPLRRPRARVRGLAENAGFALGGDIASKAGAFLALAIAARALSVREFAVLGVCLAALTILTSVLDAGASVYLVREGAADPVDRGGLLAGAARDRLPLLGVVVVGTLIAGAVVGHPGEALWTVVAAAIGAATLMASAMFRAAQDLMQEAILRLAGATIALVALGLVLPSHTSASGALAAAVLGAALALALAAPRLRAVVAPGLPPEPWVTLREAAPLAGLALAAIVYYRAPLVLLGALGTTLDTARFTVAAAIGFGVLAVPNAITTGLLPRISATTDPDERLRVSRVALRWTVLLSAFTGIALTAVAPALLAAVFGPQYRAAAGPLVVLLCAGVLIGVSGLAGTVLIAEGAVRPLLVQVAASLVANLALALALVPLLGAWGAALATLGAEALALALIARAAATEAPGLLRVPGPRVLIVGGAALVEALVAASSSGGARLAFAALAAGLVVAADAELSATIAARLGAAAGRIGMLRASVLGGLVVLGLFAAWATATGYPLRVISDTPGFLAIIPQLASAPLTHVSPFLASNAVENPHATPYTQLVALVWDRLAAHGADGRPVPDPVGLSHLLGAAGILVAVALIVALFWWVRRQSGSRAAWIAIPVLLALFGPAEVIWAGDLSFHSFLYGPFLPQTLAMALLLGTLMALDGPPGRVRYVLGTLGVATTLTVHPFTGALLCALVGASGAIVALRRTRGWEMGGWCLVMGFGLALAWPSYSIDAALGETGVRGHWFVAGCALLPVAARGIPATAGPWLAARARALRRLDAPRTWTLLAAAGLVAVVAIASVQVWQFLTPPSDPLAHSNRLSLYWVEDRWRWPLLLAAGAVGVAGLARLAARGRPLAALWFGGCFAVGVAGAAGLALPVWWRFLLFCQVPLAAGVATWIAEAADGRARRLAVGGLVLSLAFRVGALVLVSGSITYLGSPLQPAYDLGRVVPSAPGLVASDPFTSYFVPATTGHRVLVVTKAHVGSQAELRASEAGYRLLHRFFAGDDWWAAARTMYREGVRYVVIEKSTSLRAPTLETFSTGPTPLVRTPDDRRALGSYFYRNNRVGRLVHDGTPYAVYALDPAKLGLR